MNHTELSRTSVLRLALKLAALMFAFAPGSTFAETIFKCKGADGAMHYQSSKCAQTDEVSHWAPKKFTAIPYQPAALVVHMDASGGYSVKGEIEGVSVEMLVDTGASSVSIPQALAEKLKLPHGRPQRFSTANGITLGYTTVIHTLKVGDFTLHDVEAAVMSNLPGGVLLGQTALSRLKVEQSRGELRISGL